MIFYFAYGSNMDVDRLEKERLNKENIFSISRSLGRLDGFRLLFNKPSAYFIGAGAANIEEDADAHVYGTLNRMPETGLEVLDRFENVATGQYERLEVDVYDHASAATVRATTYVSRNHNIDGLKPRAGYMAHVLGGADVLPPDYTAWLRALPIMPG